MRDSAVPRSTNRAPPNCKEETVDFIERIFHVAPDGGTGSLELTIFLVFVIFPLILLALRKKRKRSSQS